MQGGIIELCLSIYLAIKHNLIEEEKIENIIKALQSNKKLIKLESEISFNIEDLLKNINTILKDDVTFINLVNLFKLNQLELNEEISKELFYEKNIFEDYKNELINLKYILKICKNTLSTKLNNGIGQTYGEYIYNSKVINQYYLNELDFSHGEIDYENINIVYFNDFHGNVTEEKSPNNRNMGMAKLVSYIKAFKNKHANTKVLVGGDSYQGTSDSNLTMGRAVSEMFRKIDVTASAVGNHEFDWGYEQMESWAKDGEFKFLAANIVNSITKKQVDWAEPFIIEEIKGIKIAIVGLAHPETEILTKVEHTKNLTFTDPAEAAQNIIDKIKNEKLADFIIGLTHLDSKIEDGEITGLASELAKSTKGFDLILSAHSHLPINGKVNGVPIIQTDYNGRAISAIELKIKDRKIVEINPKLYLGTVIKSKLIPDEESLEDYNRLQEELEPIKGEVIGYATEKLKHDRKDKINMSKLGRWSCEAMIEHSNAQIAIQNGGGLRRSLEQGNITMGDMYEIMPFDNHLVTLELNGKEIIKIIEHGINMPNSSDAAFSGIKVIYDSKRKYGNKIISITLEDNKKIKLEDKYTVVINDFLLTGGDGYDFNMARNIRESYVPLRDILVDKIKKDKVVNVLDSHIIDISNQKLLQEFEEVTLEIQ